jgi:LytS/YehU family sensor histidine kinase
LACGSSRKLTSGPGRVTFDIAGGVRQALVLALLMQSPSPGTRFIHGLRGVRKTDMIVVRAAKEEYGLAITVADNGIGPTVDASEMKIGVGLGSTCARLTSASPGRSDTALEVLALRKEREHDLRP